MILTADGFLKILNADTGRVLRSVYLSPTVTFRYLEQCGCVPHSCYRGNAGTCRGRSTWSRFR